MTLTLLNRGSQPVRLLFATSQRYDFVVKDDAGNEVWRWSADQLFAQVLAEETLAPGGTLTFGETWDQRDNSGAQVAPGPYVIEGVIVRSCPLNARCAQLVASATIHIAEQ